MTNSSLFKIVSDIGSCCSKGSAPSKEALCEDEPNAKMNPAGKFPPWLHRPLPKGNQRFMTNDEIKSRRLHTVCEEARCPNLVECYSKKTATFLILGRECTRACGFCEIAYAKKPSKPDPEEPARISESVSSLGLRHVVLTMVARDDLDDGGAHHLVECINKIRSDLPHVTVEVLTSDFNGKSHAWDLVLESIPDIFNHNVETVERLSPRVRHTATYKRSLDLLAYAKMKNSKQYVKSGLMVGLGETKDEITLTLRDLRDAGCDIITIGQYLQPSRKKLLVQDYIPPQMFEEYKLIGEALGIRHMYCGPFVRSSYNAGLFIDRKGLKVQIESD